MAQVEATAPLLDVNEVARRLGTDPRFVRRLIAERRIEFVELLHESRPLEHPEATAYAGLVQAP